MKHIASKEEAPSFRKVLGFVIAHYQDENNWLQGAPSNDNGSRRCLGFNILCGITGSGPEAGDQVSVDREVTNAFLSQLQPFYPEKYRTGDAREMTAAFNDDPETTIDTVRGVLAAALNSLPPEDEAVN
jgi:hypothetical protein